MVTPIIKDFKENPEAAIIQPKILDYKNKTILNMQVQQVVLLINLAIHFVEVRIFHELEKDNGQYNDIKEIFWATGACLFIKKEVF